LGKREDARSMKLRFRHGSLALALLLAIACNRERPASVTPAAPSAKSASAGPTADKAQDPSPPEATPRPPQTIYRSEIDRATSRGPGYLLEQLAPEPYKPAGRFQGWRITKLFPDDPDLCASVCDLAVGDIIITVNGNNIERPEQLSQLFEKLPGLEELEVHSVREGKSRKVTYRLVADPD
jgi:type II secretory pathway component PulC